jgi:hypothetical protein
MNIIIFSFVSGDFLMGCFSVPFPSQAQFLQISIAPLPNICRQEEARTQFTHYLFVHAELAGLGRVFAAPIDVELEPKNVFQPDVIVLRDLNWCRPYS